jgi:formate/nitrite transporter FocA (FNT family)
MSVAKTFSAAILGGLYVGLGGMVSLAVSGNMPGVAATNPGLVKLTFALLFPVLSFSVSKVELSSLQATLQLCRRPGLRGR